MNFSDTEAKLVLGLLKARDKELPLEIHHTDTFSFRHDLREQEKTLDDLVMRFEVALGEKDNGKPAPRQVAR